MININKNKNIGSVIYIVEGREEEPRIIREFYKTFLGYNVYQLNREDDIEMLKKENNKYSKVIIVTINKPQIKEIISDNIDKFYQEVFINKLNGIVDTESSAIYYIFDRDDKSNTKEDIEKAMNKYNNSRESSDYNSVHGLLLLSYPCIESLYLNCYKDKSSFSSSKEIKRYARENRLKKLNDKSFENAIKEMDRIIKTKFDIQISPSDLDAFEKVNIEILDKEDKIYNYYHKYVTLSLFMISLLDLEIITFSKEKIIDY